MSRPGAVASERVSDHFRTYADFESVLADAELGASTEKEVDFVAAAQERSIRYAGNSYLSAAQAAWLRDIAARIDSDPSARD